jgi:hypothetical protein
VFTVYDPLGGFMTDEVGGHGFSDSIDDQLRSTGGLGA